MLLLFFFCLKMFGGASGDSFFYLFNICFVFLLPIERRFDFPFLFVWFSKKCLWFGFEFLWNLTLNSCFFLFWKMHIRRRDGNCDWFCFIYFLWCFSSYMSFLCFFAFFLWAQCSLFCGYCCCCSLVCFKFLKLMVILFLCCCFFFNCWNFRIILFFILVNYCIYFQLIWSISR